MGTDKTDTRGTMMFFVLFLSFRLTSASEVFLGPVQGLLQLPSFEPSSCHLPGHPLGQLTNLANCYALIDSTWVKKESLKTERVHAAGSLDHLGRLVVSGGQDNFLDLLASIEVLELTGEWEAGVSLPAPSM